MTHRGQIAAGRIKAPRRIFFPLALITAAALAVRLIFCAEMAALPQPNPMFHPAAATDPATYMTLAKQIISGDYHGVFYYQPFYYTVFLPACYIVSGSSVWFTAAVQALLGAGAVWFTGLAAAEWFGRKSGTAAALIAAVSTPLILYTPFHQNETLQSFNFALLLWLCVRADRRPCRLMPAAMAGLTAGCAVLTRGSAWCFVPAILLLLAVRRGIPLRRKIPRLLVFILPLLLVQLPFAVHNSLASGGLCGPSTAADAVLALGNTVESPAGGRDCGLPAGPMEYPESYSAAMERAAEEHKSMPGQMLEWLCAAPASFLELQFRKLLLFWDGGEIPNNVSLYGEGAASSILKILIPGRSSVLLPLCMAGLLTGLSLCRKGFRKRRFLFLCAFIISGWGMTSAFYILSRFRAPLLPALAAAAGILVYPPAYRRYGAVRTALLLVLCTVIVNHAYSGYRAAEPAIMRAVRPGGSEFIRRGKKVWLDHGPLTLGGWTPAENAGKITIGKSFPHSGFSGAEITLLCPDGIPADIPAEVNGKPAELICSGTAGTAGFTTVTLPLTPDDRQLQLTITGKRVFPILDTQRDYGRSTLNGAPVHGEWVLRCRE